MQRQSILTGLAALFFVGCAAAPLPSDRMASSQASIRGAEEVGAANVPRASLHLKLAQEEMMKAQQLVKDGDNAQADLELLRAQADAELALNLARESDARAGAQNAVEKTQKFRQTGKP